MTTDLVVLTMSSPRLAPFYVVLNILVDIVPNGMLPLAAALASSGLPIWAGIVVLIGTAVSLAHGANPRTATDPSFMFSP